MKILIFETAAQAAERAAHQIIDKVQARPDCVLGLATGGTMPPVYRHMAQAKAQGAVSYALVTTFNLDEYVGLAPDHPCSYHHFMAQELFDATDFSPTRTHLPYGNTADPAAEATRYDALIQSQGPIDLQLLGIGANGHIGFNEPTSSFGSRTRIKTLTKATRLANQRFFQDGEAPPNYAITVGIETILESREVVLLATGIAKARSVADMVEGPLSAICPASALQLHPATTIILDQDAASLLKLKEYYFQVHPNGQEAPIV